MLKRIILLSLLSLLMIESYGQNSRNRRNRRNQNVEQNMKRDLQKALRKKFPTVKKVTWEKEGNNWEAAFKLDEIQVKATFNKRTKWLSTEREINIEQLPKAVKAQLVETYSSSKIEKIEFIEQANGVNLYELNIKRGTKRVAVSLQADGIILKEEREKDDDDEKG